MTYKTIFKDVLKSDYKIKKVSNDILTITFNKRVIKCKYFLLLNYVDINIDTSLITWADANPYIDKKTVEISKKVRSKLLDKKYILDSNSQIIYKNDFTDLINTLIKSSLEFSYKDDTYNCIWIINNKVDIYNEIYMITEVITF
jgi:hypothetical protein